MKQTPAEVALDALTDGLEAAVAFHERMMREPGAVGEDEPDITARVCAVAFHERMMREPGAVGEDEPDITARVCAVACLIDALELPVDDKTWGFILEARALLVAAREGEDDEAEVGGEG